MVLPEKKKKRKHSSFESETVIEPVPEELTAKKNKICEENQEPEIALPEKKKMKRKHLSAENAAVPVTEELSSERVCEESQEPEMVIPEKKKKRKHSTMESETEPEIALPEKKKNKKKHRTEENASAPGNPVDLLATEEFSTKNTSDDGNQEPKITLPEKKKKKNSSEKNKAGENLEKTKTIDTLEAALNNEEVLRNTVGDKIFKTLKEMGFNKFTSIQFRTYPHIFEGRDVVGEAQTGSGKTLAFLLPVLKKLANFPANKGTAAIVLSPTRELAQQTYHILTELSTNFPNLTHGIFLGNANREEEVQALKQGVCFMVATPGRLLDHLQNTEGFKFGNLQTFILDEVDKLLESGFLPTLRNINNLLPKKKQTLMFTATFTQATSGLASLLLKDKHVIISTLDNSSTATVSGLKQTYVMKSPAERLPFLCQLLLHLESHKVMVFFGSCRSTQYHHLLLSRWNPDLRLFRLHSDMTRNQRNHDYKDFTDSPNGALLCTDVGARGLDITNISMVIQYEPPQRPQNYIHRVGRTARGLEGVGSALLILNPSEDPFVKVLINNKVPIIQHPGLELEGDASIIKDQLKKLVTSDRDLERLAYLAFHSYYRHYRLCIKPGFKMENLKASEVTEMFALPYEPQLVYELSEKKTIKRNKFNLPAKPHKT